LAPWARVPHLSLTLQEALLQDVDRDADLALHVVQRVLHQRVPARRVVRQQLAVPGVHRLGDVADVLQHALVRLCGSITQRRCRRHLAEGCIAQEKCCEMFYHEVQTCPSLGHAARCNCDLLLCSKRARIASWGYGPRVERYGAYSSNVRYEIR